MSADIVIHADRLSKRFELGSTGRAAGGLRHAIHEATLKPWRALRGRGHAEAAIGAAGTPPTSEFWALRDLSFDVRRGDVVGIIGRNGAGKSTLLKVLSRITEPTTGRIGLKGRVGSLLEVGTGFHPELTGRENIFLNGAILGMPRGEIARKLDEIVEFAEVSQFLETPVKRYSSGMYVRLAFAVAAHLEPDILIVDEVLAVGDAAFQRKCLAKMDESAGHGRTILFVSHNLGAVRALCSRCLYLQNGRIVADDQTGVCLELYGADVTSGNARHVIAGVDGFAVESVIARDASQQPATNFQAGDSMTVDINYRVDGTIPKPYFWLEIYGLHGPIFSACMLFDGFRPESIGGAGTVSCHFRTLPLMPGAYSIRMGARRQDGVEMLMTSQEVGYFNITTSMADLGFRGELAGPLSADAASVVVPYTWELPDGQRDTFEIKPHPRDEQLQSHDPVPLSRA